MFCEKCGTGIRDNESYCSNCGEAVYRESTSVGDQYGTQQPQQYQQPQQQPHQYQNSPQPQQYQQSQPQQHSPQPHQQQQYQSPQQNKNNNHMMVVLCVIAALLVIGIVGGATVVVKMNKENAAAKAEAELAEKAKIEEERAETEAKLKEAEAAAVKAQEEAEVARKEKEAAEKAAEAALEMEATVTQAPTTQEQPAQTQPRQTPATPRVITRNSFVFPDSDVRQVTDSDLDMLTEEQIRIARNELFARRGRVFESKDMKSYFESQDWYSPTVAAQTFDANRGSYMNSVELENMKIINAYEKRHGLNQ